MGESEINKKMIKNKFVVVGAFLGASFGVLLEALYPKVAILELLYNIFTRQQLRLPVYPDPPIDGSVFAVGVIIPLLFGIVGCLVGIVIYKVMEFGSVNRK
ncbi:MAG: hypothetical protein ACD_50C00080G0005 [uncultured bacterium]|uniref:Uncharacterized protein n=1 Tax=Candidatus Woesebacteria bacterium RIFCSPLOWO2_01_FULL_39_21 TaxID=1802519 RepID=A0A1F8BCT4_9BACT|nr:MAG: hypothetical protein ACD_50C00080G0005 [uncultured bacterium]OGM22177.1 MAG: hypothetical protein A2691_01165 [Candidatus Woesebacteria bacterium RIFCSPHIGHO2_01_FULL_39_23]OGM61489.1 MAG: hypothetical protein A2961_00605 [Candidatus Woesebacteria bacterium RIFCSPLOWO2_01_FULL_39_21]